jgi:hypothetical protein
MRWIGRCAERVVEIHKSKFALALTTWAEGHAGSVNEATRSGEYCPDIMPGIAGREYPGGIDPVAGAAHSKPCHWVAWSEDHQLLYRQLSGSWPQTEFGQISPDKSG